MGEPFLQGPPLPRVQGRGLWDLPSTGPSPSALTLFLASSSRRRRLSRVLEAAAPGPVTACSSSALAARKRALPWSSQRCV